MTPALACSATEHPTGDTWIPKPWYPRKATPSSTGKGVVHALGLNLVVVTLRVTPPWGTMPIAIPVNARLHKSSRSIGRRRRACRVGR